MTYENNVTRPTGYRARAGLLLTMAMSLAVASMLVMAQTETLSTTNYRLMSQARYGAESGVQKTVNHLLNTYTAPPGVATPIPSPPTTRRFRR